jgi:hypothetical protein
MMRYVTPALERQEQRANAPGPEPTASASTRDPLLAPDASLLALVEAVRERRGTCSTKNLFLARALAERFPQTKPQIVHRVYRAAREPIRERYGDTVAELVPEDGLVDVHRYLLIQVEGRQITLDATFPGGERWDGRSSLPLACGRRCSRGRRPRRGQAGA